MARGRAAKIAGYVGSSPSALSRLAADTIAVTFAPRKTRLGPPRVPLALPGNQSGSMLILSKNSLTADTPGAAPVGRPFAVFFNLLAIYVHIP